MWMPPLYRDFKQQAEIDAQYGTQQWIPDAPAQARHFVERSAFARESLRCTLDVPFGPTLDETLDIFHADQPNAPVFVFIHGGYWRANTSKEFSCVALGPQARGFTTVVVNYSLCPKVGIDEITRQTRAAVAWVVRNIANHGGDPDRIALGGHSAGGHLTAMCLQTPWQEEYGLRRDPIKAAVLVSGLYDLEPLRYSYLQPLIQLDDRLVRRYSPLFAVRDCATPALITWGGAESDEFARQSASFHAAWGAAGNRSELIPQEGAHHFSAIHGFEHSSSQLCEWLTHAMGVDR
ncbi:alpha/beta hydrolase [Variovorax sp. Sphag1AA]|uniref:alpha/beta hydrolase n=1 Tax=Variovorax sp. Sphag1AA TaxID=2587027 RepID=UPI0017ABBF42|nr:alpha/beta hydrolase [Variovorax sp. Sphag1AA]MBB3181932.1 arylformamidase [Variovorax sp. Sphag1AA]